MKRDLDLAREILLQVEQAETISEWVSLTLPEYTSDQISEHCRLLSEAGFLEIKGMHGGGEYVAFPIRLTWHGHEFLTNAKDKSTWESAKSVINKKGLPISLEIIKAVLSSLIKEKLGMT